MYMSADDSILFRMVTVNCLEKILPGCEPENTESAGRVFRNETAAFQVAIRSSIPVARMQLEAVSDLREKIEIFEEKNVPASIVWGGSTPPDDFQDTDPTHQLFPDLLEKIHPRVGFSIAEGETKAIYVRISQEGGLPCGKFPILLLLKDRTGKVAARAEYELTIMDQLLPETDLVVTNWFHYDCLADWYSVRVFSPAFYKILDPYIRNYTSHGCNMIYTPLFTPCLDTEVGEERRTVQLIDVFEDEDTYTFGFEKLDRFVTFMRERGVRYFEFGHLFTQWGAEACPKVVVRTKGGFRKKFAWKTPSDSSEYRAFLAAFLPVFTRHIEELGLKECCFFHISDEPNEKHVEIYRKHREFLQRYLCGYKVIDALSDERFSDLVDIPVVGIRHTDKFLKKGQHIWVYDCCLDDREYVSNRLVRMPGLRTRVLGMQLYLNGTGGYLQWGHNFYYTFLSFGQVNPFLDLHGGGLYPAGDTFIVYPGRDKTPLNSLRHEHFLQAMQDYRLLKKAESVAGREKVLQYLREAGFAGFCEYPHKDIEFLRLRAKLQDLIAAEK